MPAAVPFRGRTSPAAEQPAQHQPQPESRECCDADAVASDGDESGVVIGDLEGAHRSGHRPATAAEAAATVGDLPVLGADPQATANAHADACDGDDGSSLPFDWVAEDGAHVRAVSQSIDQVPEHPAALAPLLSRLPSYSHWGKRGSTVAVALALSDWRGVGWLRPRQTAVRTSS